MDRLVERARAGDRRAEEELFREILVRFKRFALRAVDPERADEVSQMAAVTLLRKYRTEGRAGEFGAWAYGVLRMTLKGFRQSEGRRKQKEIPIPEGFELPERGAPRPQLRRHLLECLQWLFRRQSRYARILNLCRLGYTTDEICQRVGIKAQQYYVYLGRSRAMLKKCLQQRGVAL